MTAATAKDTPVSAPSPDKVQASTPDAAPHRAAVEGRLEDRELPHVLKILFGITGISLLIYLVQLFIRFVLGRKRTGTLTIDGDRLVLDENVRFVGREVRRSKEAFARKNVLSVQIETRYPYIFTLAGLTCLGFGVIAGMVLLLDGLQGEFTPWILSGVGLLLAGVLLDLVFTTLSTSMPGKTTLALWLPGRRTVRLVGCDEAAAARVVAWLHEGAA